MRWRFWVPIVVVTGIIALLSWKFLLAPPRPLSEIPSQGEYEGYLQQQAESSYKKNYYGRLIPVYEKIVKVAPESLDAKKKLAKAYIGAEQFEAARRLLEEIVQSGRGDAEIQQLFERLPQKE
ncbi:MAG: tetratricopeptide repeat protein [Deltaproteobacteria bacterium]|nr:tetratricopeptide repeat protein [Deltaproteobacteria bacterium]